MELVLIFLIGVGVGLSLGIYLGRSHLLPVLQRSIQQLLEDIQRRQSLLADALSGYRRMLERASQLLSNIERQQSSLTEDYLKQQRDLLGEIRNSLDEIKQPLKEDYPKQQRDLLDEIRNLLDRIKHPIEGVDVLQPSGLPNQAKTLPDPNSGEKAENDTSYLKSFLESRNISIRGIVNAYQNENLEKHLDKISVFMGDPYLTIREFYREIKSNMDEGRAFTMNLKGKPQQVIASICHLATELHKIAFLEEYRYSRASKILQARPSRSPQARHFLSGHWLERYVNAKLRRLARSLNKNFSSLMNVQVTLPTGKDSELDVLCQIDKRVYWFETKTGNDYQGCIEKYSSIASTLGLDANHAFLILDVDSQTLGNLSGLYRQISFINIEDISEKFSDIVANKTS